MSQFSTPLELRPIPTEPGYYLITRELIYDVGTLGSGLTITIPVDFKTDLASIPKVFWPLLPPDDPEYAPAAVVHDYLYNWHGFTRAVADAIFYEAMRVLGVNQIKAIIMYMAVRIANRWR